VKKTAARVHGMSVMTFRGACHAKVVRMSERESRAVVLRRVAPGE
jgi:hypothetical protein